MGISVLDVTPVASYGPTSQTPPGKPDLSKYFSASRSDSTAVIKAILPASSSPIVFTIFGSTVSNAVTTATLTITISDNSGVRSTGTVDVKTNGAVTALVQMSNLPLLQSVPANGDFKITAQYADTGGAATLGGPWVIRALYAP